MGFRPLARLLLMASDSPSNYTTLEVDTRTVIQSLAPDFIGCIISWFLYGFLVLQMHYYRSDANRNNSVFICATAYGVFLAETVLVVITTRVTYQILCAGWGDPEALTRLSPLDASMPVLLGLVSGWVQIFFAWRIYALGERKMMWSIMTVLIVIFALISSSTAFYLGFSTIKFTDISSLSKLRVPGTIWLSSSIACDTCIAASMIIILRNLRKRVGLNGLNQSKTETRLRSIMTLSVHSFLVTTAGTTAMLILFVAMPDSRFQTMTAFITSKLYSNSLLISLPSNRALPRPRKSILSQATNVAPFVPRRGSDMAVFVEVSSTTQVSPGQSKSFGMA